MIMFKYFEDIIFEELDLNQFQDFKIEKLFIG